MAELDLSDHDILLVDDVAFSRETIRRVLRSMNEPRIIDAANGRDAIEELNRVRSISLVIADFNMPIANGLHLLQAIRLGKTAAARTLPVAMLTGHSDQHLVASALALDVNAFAVKPVSATTLGRRLKRMLEQAQDTSWLKPPEDYETVKFPGSQTVIRPKAPESKPKEEAPVPDILVEAEKEAPKKRSVKVTRPAAAAGKFQEVERLAGEIANRLAKADASGASNVSTEVLTEGVQNIIVDTGTEVAQSVLGSLEGLMSDGRMSADDVSKALSAEEAGGRENAINRNIAEVTDTIVRKAEDVPVGAIVSGDIATLDGRTIAADGTPLTPQLLTTIAQLQLMGVLAPQSNDGVSVGPAELAIRFGNARAADGSPMALVQAENVETGTVLANDIFLSDGRPYMLSGSEFSDRSANLLQDLQELQRVKTGIWVKS